MRALFSDPGGIHAPSRSGASDVAFRLLYGVGSHGWVFRGSVARLASSLSTLRSQGHPCTTQDSLPAGGQPWPGGVRPAGFLQRFQLLPSSPPGLAWRKQDDRPEWMVWNASVRQMDEAPRIRIRSCCRPGSALARRGSEARPDRETRPLSLRCSGILQR